MVSEEQNINIQYVIDNRMPFKYLSNIIRKADLPKEPIFMETVNHVLDMFNHYIVIMNFDIYKAKIVSMQDGVDYIDMQITLYKTLNEKLK